MSRYVQIYIYIIYPTHIEYAFFQFCSWTRTQIYLEYATISCSCFFSPFGLRSGRISSKEREVPLSNRIQESKIVGWGKTKKVLTIRWQTLKTGRVPKLIDFLLLCVLKSTVILPQRVPPTNGGDPWEMIWIEQCWFKPFREIRLQTWKNLYGKKLEKWRNCMEMWRIYREKWRTTNGKSEEFDWKGKIIYMEKNLYDLYGKESVWHQRLHLPRIGWCGPSLQDAE